jgi:N,N'-diacetyllegionaminate synthase
MNVLTSNGLNRNDIVILHCNTEYPTPFEDVNLTAMLSIQQAFGTDVGYSDHTAGIEISIAAVALGAKIIEKHFTIDKNLAGPDHKASLEPAELELMVKSIRGVERALGDGLKTPSTSEKKNITIVRKSIIAAKDIRKGEPFTSENCTVKRPATGISPMRWNEVMGKIANRDYQFDEPIDL